MMTSFVKCVSIKGKIKTLHIVLKQLKYCFYRSTVFFFAYTFFHSNAQRMQKKFLSMLYDAFESTCYWHFFTIETYLLYKTYIHNGSFLEFFIKKSSIILYTFHLNFNQTMWNNLAV